MKSNKALTIQELPIVPLISFDKVFAIWEEMLQAGNDGERVNAELVLEQLSAFPELRKPFSDLSMLEQYESEISLLLSPIFPKALQLNEIKSCMVFFRSVFFNRTQRFENIIMAAGEDYEFSIRNKDEDGIYITSCMYILASHYGVHLDMSSPTIIEIPNVQANTLRTYRGFFNADFAEIRPTDAALDLSQQEIEELLDNADNVELWKQKIPPESFEMLGFGLLTIFDITADDALSAVKNNLIRKDALQSGPILEEIEVDLRRYFGIEDLHIGFAALTDNQLQAMSAIGARSALVKDQCHPKEAFCEGSYDHIIQDKKMLSIPSVDKLSERGGALFKRLKGTDFKSYLICPLVYDDQVIGILELGSSVAHAVNSVAEKKLNQLVPLFATALKRSIDEYYIKLDAIIKEKCTAIHPSVEWRFYQAARNLLTSNAPKEAEMEEITFGKVYPLFGQMDIRGSSLYRDEGIKIDLTTQLRLAQEVLERAKQEEDIFIYDQLIFIIGEYLDKLDKKLDAGDESAILSFLKQEIDPVFEQFKDRNGKLTEAVQTYTDRIDTKVKRVYEGRKKYEDTVTTINEEIGSLIEKAQANAQAMFPHYFEKYKTDGVEYNMYVGQSLVDDGRYHEMYLKNLRIWQLITTCEIERALFEMSSSFEVPLRIASLILVQDAPIDIRFRLDEKKFDVDGAYNVRYEIIKKRIDKSKVRNTEERLTQPGKLVIVYSNHNELREYQKYLQYLRAKEYLQGEIEILELEELDGASGLKALRVDINLEREPTDAALNEQVETLVASVS
ncbi:MAG: GAF domain-containing protein [Saprospiraceae bacterium]|nr:GAF domain-containing protein [Saprospiraceae bacterium]